MLFYVLVDNYLASLSVQSSSGPPRQSLLDFIYMQKVPFFANTADETHCVQASFRIMLKHFLPDQDFSYNRLDEMSQKLAGKGSWWPPLLLEIRKLGFEVKDIESFDYQAFYNDGETYVKHHFPTEVAEYHLKQTNLMDIKPLMPQFIRQIDIKTRPATFDDLQSLLKDGWLVGLAVNSRTLNNKPGYVGHLVVGFGFDAKTNHFWLHDPGLPTKPNHHISRQKLEEAWFWAGPEKAALVAVKLN